LRQPDGTSRLPPAAGVRVVAALVALLVEYAIIGLSFDGGALAQRGGWLSRFSAAGEVFTLAIVVFSAALVLQFRQLRDGLNKASEQVGPLSVGWLVTHCVAFAACLGCGFGLFARSAPDGVGLAFVALGIFWGFAALWALARGLFGPATRAFAKVLIRAVFVGAGLGLLAWQAGVHTQPLWPKLAQTTLGLSSWMLGSLSSAPVHVDPTSARLGLGEFEVEIAPGCSGVEGMGLVSIFIAGYIYRFRAELAIWRAILLVPLAAALAWLANAARIAALVAIGAWWSPDVAFGGFHSKAGWVVFCAIALSTVTLLNRSRFFSQQQRQPASETPAVENPSAGYCMPFLAVLAVALLTGVFSNTLDLFYGLRLVAALVALYLTRRYWQKELTWRVSAAGPLLGVAVFVPWFWLTPTNTELASALTEELAKLSPAARTSWFAARLLGTCAMAPIVEELAFRGFLQRRLLTWDFDRLPYAQVTVPCILASALAFGALHPSLLLGTTAGVCYSLASRRPGGLGEAVIAHAVTNLLLAVCALAFARLDLLA